MKSLMSALGIAFEFSGILTAAGVLAWLVAGQFQESRELGIGIAIAIILIGLVSATMRLYKRYLIRVDSDDS